MIEMFGIAVGCYYHFDWPYYIALAAVSLFDYFSERHPPKQDMNKLRALVIREFNILRSAQDGEYDAEPLTAEDYAIEAVRILKPYLKGE